MNKCAVAPAIDFYSLRLCCGGTFHGATSTVFRVSLRHFSAIFANWLEPCLSACYFPAVNFRMTILTKSCSIRNLIAQFWIILPCFYVVGVYHSNSPAFFAGEIISFVNSSNPLFIFISAAFISVWFSRSIGFALARAILSCVSMIANPVLLFTPTTNEARQRVMNQIAIVRAESLVLPEITFFTDVTRFINSTCWHTHIVPQVERMAVAFPDLSISLADESTPKKRRKPTPKAA